MIQRHKIFTLISVVIAATLIHILALLWVKDVKIDFIASGKALMENHTRKAFDEEKELAKQEEIKKKNEFLAEVLKKVVQESPKEEKVSEDKKLVELKETIVAMEPVDPQLPQTQEKEPSEIFIKDDKEVIESLASSKHSISEEKLSSEYLRRPTPVEILYPRDEYFAEELIMATEMALGAMEPETTEKVLSTQAVRAGREEEASLKGLSLENRSGMLDIDLAKPLQGSGGSFSLSSEFGHWNYHSPNHTKGTPNRDPLLNGIAKNALRGFDYNSLGGIASSDDFELAVEYSKRKEGGYLFKLELSPKEGIKFKRIKQNVFFLVDRSHSIRLGRYEATKNAVIKALALLHAGDSFNVLVFDNTVVRLAPENRLWDTTTVNEAHEFIKNQPYGGIFASTDLYASLGTIVPEAVAENEVNTAILLSDGDTYLSLEKQRSNIGKWTKKNEGKVSLYAVASGKGNQLALLDLLSTLNKGSLHYSTTDKGLENTLFNLMQNIRNPIGKEITISTVLSEPGLNIEICPIRSCLPNLYENIPYVVYGFIEQLIDFHVFFQGRYYDKYFDIKQAVSFKKAKEVDLISLEKKWALQQAYIHYNQYLEDGHVDHLNQAKTLLLPYRIPIAFN